MNLEFDLRAIWDKFASQRQAELDAVRTREDALRELNELNTRRLAAGLPMVSEYRETNLTSGSFNLGPMPRTWRDDLRDQIMARVTSEFE